MQCVRHTVALCDRTVLAASWDRGPAAGSRTSGQAGEPFAPARRKTLLAGALPALAAGWEASDRDDRLAPAGSPHTTESIHPRVSAPAPPDTRGAGSAHCDRR